MNHLDDKGDAALRDRLRSLRVDPPDAGFTGALHRRLAAAGEPSEPSLFQRLAARRPAALRLAWPAAGLAAGLACFLSLSWLRPPAPQATAGERLGAATEVPSTKVAVIRVNLVVEAQVASAEIRIQLPDGIVFWTDGEALARRSFGWTQPLAAGDNEIPIAVRGSRPGLYRVKVSARIGDEWVDDEIPLEVVGG